MAELNVSAYEQIVDSYAKESTNFLFHNQGNEHALVVFKSIFKNATKRIRIAAGSLSNTEVANSQEYIDALRGFLDRPGTKLNILLSDYTSNLSLPLFEMLANHEAYREGRVVLADGEGRNFRRNGEICHFCTADSHMYRVETDVKNRKAECNFGDKSMTEILEGLFDKAFAKGKKVRF